MKMCLTNEADCFCIASSDSDFIDLVFSLQSYNKKVIIVGKADGAMALVKVCDVYIDERTLPQKEKLKIQVNDIKIAAVPAKQKKPDRIIPRKPGINITDKIKLPPFKNSETKPSVISPELIDEIFKKTVDKKIKMAHKNYFMRTLKTMCPEFDLQRYGYKSVIDFLDSLKPRYELITFPNKGIGLKKIRR